MQVGDRVKLIFTSDPHTRLKAGDQGVIRFIDSLRTVHVKWDNGSNLGMVPGEDAFTIMPINWKPFPEIEQYLAIEGDTIIACPMSKDGSRCPDGEICQVDEEDTLYRDLFNVPEDNTREHIICRQALRALIEDRGPLS